MRGKSGRERYRHCYFVLEPFSEGTSTLSVQRTLLVMAGKRTAGFPGKGTFQKELFVYMF